MTDQYRCPAGDGSDADASNWGLLHVPNKTQIERVAVVHPLWNHLLQFDQALSVSLFWREWRRIMDIELSLTGCGTKELEDWGATKSSTKMTYIHVALSPLDTGFLIFLLKISISVIAPLLFQFLTESWWWIDWGDYWYVNVEGRFEEKNWGWCKKNRSIWQTKVRKPHKTTHVCMY